MRRALAIFASLRNPIFAQLYAAQTASLLGDALTWIALALLAFELAGQQAAIVLGIALTLRVTAFVILSPLAGALADRLSRKAIMVIANLGRIGVLSLLPLVSEAWQVYLLMFLLNSFTAFFTPTFQATIPLVTGQRDYPRAIALSGATFELLGVLGPGIAGALAVVMGGRSLFWLNAGALLLSTILILALRADLKVARQGQSTTWADVTEGTSRLWRDPPLRYALLLDLVASVAGAWVLVNTVVHVKGNLALGELQFGWVMAAFGVGATLAALAVGALDRRLPRTTFIFIGALAATLAVLPANLASFAPLLVLWFIAGAGQNWVNLPVQTLIADRTPEAAQGRVYGAHFAWSHLWWAGAYPLAGWLGSALPATSFWYGGLVGLVLLVIIQLIFAPARTARGASASD